MIDEPLRDDERPGCEPHTETDPPTVTTTPGQVLTGLQVGLPDLRTVCSTCGDEFREGQAVFVSAYRTADAPTWDLVRCACPGCAPADIEHPTLGVTEALVRARLSVVSLPSSRTHRHCLTEVEPVAFSPPTEGSQP